MAWLAHIFPLYNCCSKNIFKKAYAIRHYVRKGILSGVS